MEHFDEAANQRRLDEGLVSLHIQNHIKARQFFCHLGDAVGSGWVLSGSERHIRAEREGRLGDAHIIRRDDHLIRLADFSAALPHMLNKRLAGKFEKGFPR